MPCNLFRCGCGDRGITGTGDPEFDNNLQQAMSDHARMGHNVLKPLKVPSNPIQDRYMSVHDEDVDCKDDDESYAYYKGKRVS